MFKTRDFYAILKSSSCFPAVEKSYVYCETEELAKQALKQQEDLCDFSGTTEKPEIIKLQMLVEKSDCDRKTDVAKLKAIYQGYKNGTDVAHSTCSPKKVDNKYEKEARNLIEVYVLPNIEKVLKESRVAVIPQVSFTMEPSGSTCNFLCCVFDRYGKVDEKYPSVKKTIKCSMSVISAIKKMAQEYDLFYYENVLNDAEYKLVVGIDFEK